LRLPPTFEANKAMEILKKLVEKDPPYGAEVSFTSGFNGDGWNAPNTETYLDDCLERAS